MLSINFQSRDPIYDQLYNNIIKLIAIGELAPGDRLPPVRTVALELGINPNTAAKAYRMLERDNIICTVVGKGSFISDNADSLNSKKKLVLEKLEKVIKEAFDCGFTKEELIALIEHNERSRGDYD